MTFQTDCNDVRQILHYFEDRLCENEAADDIRMDFNQLICLLDSPLFARLANVEEALTTLADISRIHAISETDFDIDVDSGEIRFSSRHGKKLNNQGLQQHVGYDSYDEEKQNNNQVRKKHMIAQHPNEGEIEMIELQKPEGQGIGLGFGIVGLSSVTRELGVFVHEIQPGSIAARDGRLRENDKILAINGRALNETAALSQAVQLLQAVTGKVALIVAHGTRPELEQNISVTEQSVAMSPLSVASESIFSCDYIQLEVIDLYNDGSGLGFGIISGRGYGVLIKTIVPNGISDKDGRLKSGDRILMIGDVDVRNMNTEGVATELRQSSVHVRLVVARNLGSLPPPAPHGGRQDTLKVTVLASQLNEELEKLKRKTVAAEEDSQLASAKGDDMDTLPQMSSPTMPSDVLPEVDVFEVELTKDQSGLGITIAGYNDPNDGVPHIFVNDIADGSVAALDGRIRLFDRIIQVDGHALKGCDNQKALDVFRKTGQVVHLKIARPKIGAHFEPVSRRSVVSDSRPTSRVDSVYMNTNSEALPNNAYLSTDDNAVARWQSVFGPGYQIIVANLVKPKPSVQLGISLEGIVDKETGVVHHTVRSILPDGVVGISGLIMSDDELVEVNGIKLYGLSHSEIVHVLRELPAEVCLIAARGTQTSAASEYISVEQSVTSLLSSTPPVPTVDINRSKHTLATPIIDRLVKAKSEQALFNPSPAVTPLNQNRSKSLDSLAMFGLWSSDPVEVELEKGDQGLGFSILDYPDTLDPNKTMIIVRGLVPDGTAHRDGRLQPGDRLVSVNDISLFNASLDMAVQSLVGAPKGVIRLTVLKQERFGSSNTDVDQEMTSWPTPGEEVNSSPTDHVNDTRQSAKQHTITVTGSSGKVGVNVESLLDKGQRGCVVTSLDPDGRLAQDGQLAVGDVILSINKDDMRDVSSVQARAILRRLSLIGTADLTIVFTRNESNHTDSRTPDLLSQVVAKEQNYEDSFKSNTHSPSILSSLSLPLLSVAEPDDQFSAGVKSAMSSISNWGPSHVVEVFRKEGESLGISIVGGHIKQLPGSAGESGKVFSGIFIKHIRPDSPAGRNGIIQTGDHILEVNGVDVRDVTHDQAVDAIRNAASPIRFLVRSLVSVPGITTVEPEAIPVAANPSALKKALPVTGSTSSDGSDDYEDDDDDPSLQQQLSPLPDLHSDDEQYASDLSALKLSRQAAMGDEYLAAGRISPSRVTATDSVEMESLDNVAVFSLTKGDRGFGFAIEELPLKGGSQGIFVRTISPDGPAAEEGTLSVGDRLLKVDEVSLYNATYNEALLALRQFNIGSAVRLTVNKASLDGSDLHDTSSVGSDNGSTPAASSVSPSHRMPAVTLTSADDKPTILPAAAAEVSAAAATDDPATREIVPGRETTIEIQKGKTGLGLSIIGGSDTLLGAIVVHEVYDNGAAARDGRLWAGDQILEVCGESLRSTTHERAIQILRQTPSVVKLVVLREVEVLSDGDMYETIPVDLVKKRHAGLGFSIVNRPSGVFISDLVKGGVAECDGRLMPGDHIVSLNGTDVTDATQEQIAEFLRTSTGVVSIAVRRLKPGRDGQPSIAGVNYQSSAGSRNGLELPVALHEKAKSGSSATSSSSPPDQKAADDDDDTSTITVELTRHERGLLMLKLAPEQTTSGSPSKGHLIIIDLHGTGKAIGDKLQVYDKILSINGQSTRGMNERDACQLIQASGDNVVIIVIRGQQTLSSTTAATESARGVSVDEPDDTSQYSESMRNITIRRGPHGFGFSIVGGRDEKMGSIPIYIKQVFPGGPADVDGRLKRGDQLLTVNGKSLEGFTHEQAVEALKNASGNVVFTVVG